MCGQIWWFLGIEHISKIGKSAKSLHPSVLEEQASLGDPAQDQLHQEEPDYITLSQKVNHMLENASRWVVVIFRVKDLLFIRFQDNKWKA